MSMVKAEKCLKAMTEFYIKIFGEKWQRILKGMEMPKSQCALINNMVEEGSDMAEKLKSQSAVPVHLKSLHRRISNRVSCVRVPYTRQLMCLKSEWREFEHPVNHLSYNGKMSYFLMDLSSLLPVLALDIQPADFVLDMCASPGGKTLAIAMQLSEEGQLISNELNLKRRKRLYKVLEEYLPRSTAKRVKVTNLNAASFGSAEPNSFDKVLLDAPCSSDRHLLHENFRFSGWSVKKSREFAELQKKLLTSAIRTVRIGGTVVYSTCSLSPIENDAVIESTVEDLNALRESRVETVDFVEELNLNEFCISNTTKHGLLVIPSETKNWGPMYTCKMLRVS